MSAYGSNPGILETQLRRKRRRNSSPSKQSAPGISFSIDQNKRIAAQIQANQDSNVVFSDRVLRLDKKMKLVTYQFIITSKAYYLFKDKSGKFKESNALKDIESVSLSHQSDNFMLIKIKGKSRPDALLVSRRKTQISQILMQQTINETSQFPFSITDKFRFLHIDKKQYFVIFTGDKRGFVEIGIYKDDSVPEDTSISAKKKK